MVWRRSWRATYRGTRTQLDTRSRRGSASSARPLLSESSVRAPTIKARPQGSCQQNGGSGGCVLQLLCILTCRLADGAAAAAGGGGFVRVALLLMQTLSCLTVSGKTRKRRKRNVRRLVCCALTSSLLPPLCCGTARTCTTLASVVLSNSSVRKYNVHPRSVCMHHRDVRLLQTRRVCVLSCKRSATEAGTAREAGSVSCSVSTFRRM